MTLDDKTLEVEVGAFDEIATIAGKFSIELANKDDLKDSYSVESAVDENDSKKYTITFKTTKTGKDAVAPKVTVKFVAK